MNAWYESVTYTCLECGSGNIIYDDESGEVICGDCGLVVRESIINKGPEASIFGVSSLGVVGDLYAVIP